ncbi:hypothetical protein MY520_23140, partial [Geodermatophilus sp. CPCC 205506]
MTAWVFSSGVVAVPPDLRNRPVVLHQAAPAGLPHRRWPEAVLVTAGGLLVTGAFLLAVVVGAWAGLSLAGGVGPGTVGDIPLAVALPDDRATAPPDVAPAPAPAPADPVDAGPPPTVGVR